MTNIATKLYAKHFVAFVEKAFRTQMGGRLDKGQLYIPFLAHVLEQFLAGNAQHLLVNLPGRHLKTFLCSICLPAFALGLDPTLTFIIVTYSEELAEDIVRQIRDLMATSWYRAVFKTRISRKHALKRDFATEGGGRVRAVALGSMTGKGGKIIIFDDAHNVFEWDDERRKEKVIEAFETLTTRADDGVASKMLVVGHRVAEDDLSAHILKRGGFEHLALPLFAPKKMIVERFGLTLTLEKDEALRPDAFPPEHIEKIKQHHRGAPLWLYHQQGLDSPDSDFRLEVSDFPILQKDRLGDILATGAPVVLSVDPAQGTNSTSRNVVHAYVVKDGHYLLVRASAERCTFKQLLNKIVHYANFLGAAAVIVEKTARGSDLIERLTGDLQIPIIAVNPRGSKSDRLRQCAPIIKAKRIAIVSKPEVEAAIAEIVGHPNAPNDDHVDALTNMLGEVPKLDLPARASGSTNAPRGIAIANHQCPLPSPTTGIGYAPGRSIFSQPVFQPQAPMINGGSPSRSAWENKQVHTSRGPVIIRKPS